MTEISKKLREQADNAIVKQVIPALQQAIQDVANEIYENTRKQHPMTHAPEIRVQAQHMATLAVLTELVRYLSQNPDAETAIKSFQDLTPDKVKQWLKSR